MPDEAVALVTGAAGGIGAEVADMLSRRGFIVVGSDKAQPSSDVATGSRFYPMDITREPEVSATVARVVEELGRLDVVVAAAGVASRTELSDVTQEELEHVVGVNLFGSFYTVQAGYREMLRGGHGGRIIVLTSVAASVGGVFAGPHYVAAKAGLGGLVRSVARTGAPNGILVNAVAPGVTETSMTRDFPYNDEQFPLGRVGQPEDIAGAVSFLASDESAYITGTTLHVNGGVHFGC